MPINLVEGWTDDIDYQLKADGVAVNLTGLSAANIVLKLYDKNKTAVTPGGTLTIVTAATGIIRYVPGATELVASKSPYSVRFQLTDGSSKKSFFPNGDVEKWIVRKP